MPTAPLPFVKDPDTHYELERFTLLLAATRYPARAAVATRADDGIIDETVVERRCHGDKTTPMSGRELLCAVARMSAANMPAETIAERLGFEDPPFRGRNVIRKLRERNGIPVYPGVYVSNVISTTRLLSAA